MMVRRRWIPLLVATLALALVALLVERPQAPAGRTESENARSDTPERDIEPEAVPPNSSAPTAMVAVESAMLAADGKVPLPELGLPLVELIETLEEQARQGDARAACRLAMDGALCRDLDRSGGSVDFFIDDAARRESTHPVDVDFIVGIESRESHAARLCAGLPAHWADDNTWRYMLQAAQAGHHGLAARFAAAPPLDQQRFLEQLDRWQAYAAHAPGLLRAAAESGDPRAMYYLQRALSGQPTLRGMPNAIAPDLRTAALLALALYPISDANTRRNLDAAIERAQAALNARDWAALEAEAAALSARHFDAHPVIDFSAGVFGDQDASICDLD